MDKKKKKAINLHAIIGIALLVIVIICVIRIIQWNSRTTEVDLSDINEGDYDMECLDFYVYPDDDQIPEIKNVLVLGNNLVNSDGEDHSVINILKDKMDANFIDLSVEKSKLTSDKQLPNLGVDAYSLYHLTNAICTGDYQNQINTLYPEGFYSQAQYDRFIGNLQNLNMDEIDTILIMYSLHDYFASVYPVYADEFNVTGYHGALLSSIKLLQENFPKAKIILASPCPVYMVGDNGELLLGSITDFGKGNSSIYINNQYAVATELCISFIDNYFYTINEDNIEEYVDEFFPNDKGIDIIANHIINFINNKG